MLFVFILIMISTPGNVDRRLHAWQVVSEHPSPSLEPLLTGRVLVCPRPTD